MISIGIDRICDELFAFIGDHWKGIREVQVQCNRTKFYPINFSLLLKAIAKLKKEERIEEKIEDRDGQKITLVRRRGAE